MTQNPSQSFRLSPQQQHLWRLQQAGGSGAFRAECVVRIDGGLDPAVLRSALAEVIRRHEIVRTSFRQLSGITLQVIGEPEEPELPLIDLAGLDPGGEEARQALLGNLGGEAVLQACLGAISPSTHLLAFRLPALCSDALSLDNLVRDLASCYDAQLGRGEVPLEAIQYVDVAEILNELLVDEETREGRAFWQNQDLAHPPGLRLVGEREDGSPEPFAPECVTVPLRDLAPAMARAESLEGSLLAGWQALLWRLTGETDVLVGVAMNGRIYSDLDDALGPFVKYVPLRCRLASDQPFSSLVREGAEKAAAAAEWQAFFNWSSAAPENGFCRYAFDCAPRPSRHAAGDAFFSVQWRRAHNDRFVVKLSCAATDQGWMASFHYDPRLLQRRDVELLAERYQALVASAAGAADLPLGDLEVLGDSEREELLCGLNSTRVDFGAPRTLTDLFAEQAASSPQATAVVFGDQSLTYAALAGRVERLAAFLSRLGVGPETRVGLSVDRSFEMVVGMLGILRAGGAFVPLDPAYPLDRLRFLLEDAGVDLLLTEERWRDELTAATRQVVFLDTDGPSFAETGEAGPMPGAAAAVPENLAYVIYTSGSTGRPKGVMVSHKAIANRLLWMQHAFPLTPADSVLQKTPFSFDASIWEIFCPLFAGARLVLAEPGGHRDPAYLLAAVAEHEVSTLQLVPSLLPAFLEQENLREGGRSLRRLFCGGEALSAVAAERFFSRLGGELVNLYGPTEVAIDASFHLCSPGEATATVPIGRPLANVQVYLLDRRQRPVPWGVAGELYVGGNGVARGYLRRPDLTAERFVPNPFSAAPGDRLYRTGDLARHLPEGDLEFLGRVDHQVKVRGFRIELGEIEEVLRQHPAVQEAVVVARGDQPGEHRLAAYAEPRQGLDLDLGSHQLHLLPNGMEVACVNPGEAEVLYEEIFAEELYLAHDISLAAGDCIFDVGANIGMFSLFMAHACPNARLYSFEPIPTTFDVLRTNIALYGVEARLFECGLSDRSGSAQFTFYPHWSAMSGAYADIEEEEEIGRAALGNQIDLWDETARDLIAERFRDKQVFTCALRSLSEVIREEGVERIDLLKIDAEKSEMDVLAGLAEEDWPKVEQMIVELHDVEGRLERMRTLLEERGFQVVVDQDRLLQSTTIYNLYAIRPERAQRFAAQEGGARQRREPLLRRAGLTEQELRAFLSRQLPEHMVPPDIVVMPALPRLPNGKLDRSALPAPELLKAAPERSFAAPRNAVEELLSKIWLEVLGAKATGGRIGIHDNFFQLGGDSILSIQVISRAGQAGLRISARQMFEHQTIAELAAVAVVLDSLRVDAGAVIGPVQLTPIQRGFFEQDQPRAEQFNQSLLLAPGKGAREPLDPALLRRAVEHLVLHHDALRMRFLAPDAEHPSWRQLNGAPGGEPPVVEVDLSALPEPLRRQELEQAAAALQGSLDLIAGPLLRVALFGAGEAAGQRLLLAIHHLVVDGVSWRILLEDLETLYRQGTRGEPLVLPARTTSFQRWAERLTEYAQTPAALAQAGFWLKRPWPADWRLPVDREDGENTVASARNVVVAFDADETRALLQEAPKAYRTQINDLLLAALAAALEPWTGRRLLVLELEGHGREELFDDVDISRTVGWFTTVFPVLLDLEGVAGPGESLKAVKEQLRALPGRGIGFGLVRYLGEGEVAQRLRQLPRPELSFNYLGQLDGALAENGILRGAEESAGAPRHPSQRRAYLLDINGAVSGGRLSLSFGYSANRHDRRTIEGLAERFGAALRALVAHCLSPEAGGFTPSDFPLAGLDAPALDRLIAQNGTNVEDLYPASPLQEGMLFHALHSPGEGAYLAQLTLTMQGDLDPDAFASAWQQVVDRHPSLRTGLVWEGLDRTLQLVRAHLPLTWERQDWSDATEPEQAARLSAYLEADWKRDFDLSTPPLLRLALFRCGDTWRFVWTFHHSITDGWSLPILIRELFASYTAAREGTVAQLPPVRPYRDYIAWLQGQDQDAAERFWRDEMAGLTAPTTLGWDGPAASRVEHDTLRSYGLAQTRFPAALTDSLRAFSRQHQLTLNTVIQGVWALLLSRYGGEEDVVFGVVSSGRSAPISGIESIVGLFINTIPARVVVPARAIPVPWLRQLQDRQAASRHFEHSALSQIQEWSGLPKGATLFESIMAFENYPVDEAVQEQAVKGLGFLSLSVEDQTHYPLSLTVVPGAQLGLRLLYEHGRFEAATIERLLGHAEILLAGLLSGVDQRLDSLPLLSSEERQQVQVEWNATSLQYPQDASLGDLFAAQAARSPERVAVEFGDEVLSYAELDRRSSQLARHLAQLGAGPGARVGVCLERSVALVVALLGTLRAGAAYVPLDPAYPPQRRAFMLADAGAAALLTDSGLAAQLAAEPERRPGLPVVRLDADGPEIARQDGAPPAASVAPESLAYVIYTSGSTGAPKGVMVSHRAIANRLLWMQQAFPLTPDDSVLQKTPFGFDASIWEIFCPLFAGARVVLAEPGGHRDPAYMLAAIARHQVTVLQLVPSLLPAFLEQPDLETAGRSLRRLFCGGEALSGVAAARFFSRSGGELVNLYGPTEVAIDASFHVCSPAEASGIVPIGRPLANVQIYLLNRQQRSVPQGVAGELYVGGRGLAWGYLGRPDLTAERFVPHPFSAAPGERLYRTGDLARLRARGELEFLGRIDHQVKVRGFRIELGEIDEVLRQHPGVQDAVAVVRGEGPGEHRLAAYVLLREGLAPDLRAGLPEPELRTFLSDRLPEHMVPPDLVVLPALPRLPNGKLDRGALPDPDLVKAAPERSFAAPRNPVEETLARIWLEVLGAKATGGRIGIHDNFFQLGGDSILSIQLISRAGQAGLRISARQIFGHPTIAELATVAVVAESRRGDDGAVTGQVPLTPIQRGFFELGLVRPEHYNQSLLLAPGTGAREPLAPALLRRAVERLVLHHDALRMRFQPPGPDSPAWRQVNGAPEGEPPVGEVDLSALPEPLRLQALEAGAAALQASLDLTAGPLLRVALFCTGEAAGQRLLLTIHHLVVDAVSWRILLADLETLYRQAGRGEPLSLPARTASFQRWAERLVAYAQSPDAVAQGRFWLEKPWPAGWRLPLDREDGENTVASARNVVVSLGADETRALLQEAPKAYRTQINDLLLTALVEALWPWTGSRRLLLELEGHGREELFDDVDISRTVGWFTTVSPVFLDLEGVEQPGEALKTVKEHLRALPGRGISFGLLRYLGEGEVAERLRRLPRPELSFNYLGQLDGALAEEGLLRGAAEPAGAPRNPLQRRTYLLDINGAVSGGRLSLSFGYSANLHDRQTVEDLAERFRAALRGLVAHCLAPEAGGFTPSDFPLAGLDTPSLDRLIAAVGTNVEDLYPASPLQEGMLFHALHAPAEGSYVAQMTLTLDADLNLPAFESAWQQVVDRHPSLRTGLVWLGLDRPLQLVRARLPLTWERQDWSDATPQEQEARLAAYLRADRRRGFDLSSPPLLRLALFRCGDTWRFIWTFHHSITDGWSMPILIREIFASYSAAAEGGAAELPPVRPYRDYVAWLQGQDMAAAERFWREELAGLSAPAVLGWDGPGTLAPVASDSPRSYRSGETRLSAELTEALRGFARQHQLTLNTVLQGSWALLLSRYGGEDAVVFGVVTSGRSAPISGIEAIVGLFINTLPARVEVPAAEVPVPWLRRLQERQTASRQFEHSPLSQIQAWSGLPKGATLFESILAFENYPVDEAVQEQAGRGLGVSGLAVTEQTHYPLSLAAAPGPRLGLRLLYETSRYDPASIDRLLGHLTSLLEGLLAGADQPLATLPLLGEAERHQVRVEWNATASAYPRAASLGDLFAAQAAGSGERVAVEFEDGVLTYAELDRRSNQVARHLRQLGAGPGTLVGVSLERSAALIVAVVGTVKAGAAYVPLDPTYPPQRRAFMLADARVSVLLTQASLAPQLAAEPAGRPAGLPVVRLDADWPEIARQDGAGLASGGGPESLAYVIYTSGSTGAPKGVAVPHQAVARLVINTDYAQIQPDDRVAQVSNISFDAATFEIWGALLNGAVLAGIPPRVVPSPRELVGQLRERRISALFLTTALFNQVIAEEPAAFATLRHLLTGGEMVDPGAMRAALRGGPPRNLLHVYGPTESTTFSTWLRVDRVAEGAPTVPIGRPIANTRAYVLDRHLRPVPIGVVGELYIAGDGLAREYLNQPELTRERFVTHPAWGERLYRTGDLARLWPAGEIEFLGRRDQQIKLRGFRIELGEIESALTSCAGVRQAAVVLRDDLPGGRGLLAFVVADEGPGRDAGQLRQSLQERLPQYMLPADFSFLDTLPLTANGKVDRRDLIARPWSRSSQAARPAPQLPLTPTGELVARIFSELLAVETVRADDDFFVLGGHSLLATQLISRLRRTFDIELPLAEVFVSPTVTGLAEAVEAAIREQQGDLVLPPLEPWTRGETSALGLAQQRLWFLHQLDPASAAYNLPLAIRLTGELDGAILQRSVAEIVRRHETLRTVFAVAAGEPLQVVRPWRGPADFTLPCVDLSTLGEGAAAEARRLAAEEALRPFDLARGPLLRVCWLRLSAPGQPGDHVVLANMHHIVSDGWSMGVLAYELGTLYGALQAGRPSPLADLPVQYADYALWQRHWLEGAVLEREVDYWRESLRDLPVLLELPTDRPRPAVLSNAGALRAFHVPQAVAADLNALGRGEGATLYMVLLAAFSTLLGRLAGQTDLAVGTPIAGRNRVEIEGLIGFFVNTLVLRADLAADPAFRGLLEQVRTTTLQAFAHPHLPFERLVEELAPVRSLAHTPLFQALFALQNVPIGGLELPGLAAAPFPFGAATAKFDLTLSLTEVADGLAGTLEYNRDLFDATTIERWIGSFTALLAAAGADPLRRLSDLPLLNEAEGAQLLVQWNDTATPARPFLGLHELVSAQAARTPDAVALVAGDAELTYQELDRRASLVAGHLLHLGVQPEARVGLLLERSIEMIVGLLGVLRAGAAYVPLDPAYPSQRRAFLLGDAGVTVLLTTADLAAQLAAEPEGRPDLPLVRLDADWPEIARQDAAAVPAVAVTPASLAYVIYTSGSTGAPKGVMMSHKAIANRLLWTQDTFPLTPADRLLQKTPFSFDASIWEIFCPLLAGARLVLAEPGGHRDPAAMLRAIAEHQVTLLQLVPSLLPAFLDQPGVETAGRSLRRLFCGGEALSGEAARRFFRLLDGELINLYGPTEVAIDASYHVCAPVEKAVVVPIGRPLANAQVYLLSPQQRPVPRGAAGELYVGGHGLARGYLRRPELTAERFVPNPFSAAPGERLYRTGDLARYLAGGELEFLGRIDHQVKVRGLRIELGEVETALLRHPGVGETVVVPHDAGDGARLVAYVVPADGAAVQPPELRAFLRDRLPEFMVPAVFVPLAALPVTSSGKIDRRALPRPEQGARGGDWDYRAPRTPIEELLAGIWSDLLRVEQVGVDDDFFELGGHSLQGIRLVARVREVLGVELPIRTLFVTPTLGGLAASITEEMLRQAAIGGDGGEVAAGLELAGDRLPLLAAQLQERQKAAGGTGIRPLERRDGPLPLSFAQERLWFLEQLEPGTAFYNIPGTVRLEGELRFEVLVACLEELTRRHETLRTTFGDLDGRPYQRVEAEARVTVPFIDLAALPREAREAELRELATWESRQPFDLSRGPLLRVVLFRLGPGEQVVVYTTHHIISDGWSAAVFLREVASLYEAFSAGRPAELPALPVQYADYAAWQREYLEGPVLEAQLAYWRDRLAGTPALELPTDRARPAVETFHGASREARLPQEVGRDLIALSRREGATLFMTLLALFKTLLLRYSGQTDLAVGSPVANRNRPEVEGVIGFFANTVVLRTDVGGNPSFRELLARVREVALGAYSHEDLPFERVVEELQPERDMSRNPLFQVMCVLQNQPRETLPAGDLRMTPFSVELGIAKFDLTLFWYEEQGWLSGLLEFNTDLFDPSTAARFYQHYQNLLHEVIADPGRSLLDLPLLDSVERHQLVHEWSDTVAPAEERCVHHWVEEQVERTPDAVAAAFGDQRLTYRELNRRANRMAHGLMRRGVGPESLVGICVDRSLEMVVAALAVLKAGGGLVALDPAYPRERLATIIEDAGLAVLLTEEPLLQHFPRHRGIALCLTAGTEPFPDESSDNPVVALSPDNPMYAIYTSGSTGQPKGIVVPHRAFANLAAWQLGSSPSAGTTRTVQFATFGFCVSFQEIFSSWCSGGTLVVADEATRRDAERLVELLADEGIERLHLPFAALKQLADVRDSFAQHPLRLREIITAGEQLRVTPAVRDLLGRLPGCSLHNQYGASETHVVCDLGLEGAADEWPALPSVGRPVANVRIHLLDARLEPVPIGVRGELYAAGACLSRAYLNDPVLTAQKMVPDPFAGQAGARLYRTGDLARHRADGQIEFLGRADTQVKIRGFRVELGEVETVMASHPRVRDAAAVAQPMGAAGPQLVAYVVPEEGDLAAEELRGYLKQRLPEYMIPVAFVQLGALPLNANGKLDQAALPVPEAGDGPAGYVAPRTPTEDLLAGLWAEVLHRERVGAHDNFFEVGGHSLLATQVVSRARAAFGVELPVRALFEAPTLAELAGRIEALRQGEDGRFAPPLAAAPRSGPLPLSFSQERLWFLDRLEPESPAYNMPLAVRLVGDLHVPALTRSLAEIVRRHEALRTVFAEIDGQPVQVVGEALPSLPLVDLSALGTRAEAAARQVAGEEARRPFDLERGPLFRPALLRLPVLVAGVGTGTDQHVVLATMHHIVSDGWSLGVVVRELVALYGAFAAGRPALAAALPELPIQYADFALWQRRWLSGDVLAAELDYWRRQLQGLPPRLELPTDRPRPAVLSAAGGSLAFAVGERLSAGLRRLGRQEGATLFMVLLACFEVVLARSSGQLDLAVGTPVAGRNRLETEGLIGFFVNTLVLRAPLAGDPSLRELLARVREVTLGAYAHQDVPFEKLVGELAPERSLAHSPLFQVMFALQNAPLGALELPGLSLAPFGSELGVAKFEVNVSLTETPTGLAGTLDYSADLFEAPTMLRLAEHLERLLESAVREPGRRISELDWLSGSERQQILVEWNAGAPARPADALLHARFEAQVALTPDAEALAFEGGVWSYGELNRRANRIAHRLLRLGVEPEAPVGICMERRPEMVVALLAVLKAGGAYVPLDPAYPAERLGFMLEDSAARVVVTLEESASRLPDGPALRLSLDGPEAGSLAGEPESDPPARSAAGHLAYLIYTSGSTGRPKGVAIEHRSAVAFLDWASQVFSAAELAGVLAGTSISFDLSVFEIFVTLGLGGRVILGRDALHLASHERAAEVTLINTVPSAISELLRLDAVPASVRTVNLAGEPLPGALVERLYALPHVERVYNLYGPSEDTTYSTWARMAREATAGMAPGIGRPIAGTRAHVLDPGLHALPVGVAGELCLGGAGLARGYRNRPELTAERFVPDPFAGLVGEPGARLYRTGDLARHRPDGTLDFLGRIDHQVKVRGFRIELGEIEAALVARPGVRGATVLAVGEGGERRLVAFVAARPEAAPNAASSTAFDTAELRESLRCSLPEPMVPAAFLVLDELPLTPNGKVDRKALARLAAEGAATPALRGEAVPPRDLLEARLVQLWEELLDARPVGVTDNFFTLGGHSLLAVRLVSRLRALTGRTLPLSLLFQAPTVESLARELRREGPAPGSVLVPLQSGGVRPTFFCVHPAGGHAFRYAALARALGTDQPFFAFQSPGLAGEEPVPMGVGELADRYLAELRQEQPHGPYYLGGWSMGGLVAFEMARRLEAAGEEVALLALFDSRVPGGEATRWEEDGLESLVGFALELGLTAEDAEMPLWRLRELAPEERLEQVLAAARRAGLLLPDTGGEEMRRLYAVFRENLMAQESWQPAGYGGRVSFFLPEEEGEPSRGRAEDWGRLARGGVEVVAVPGDHHGLMRPPHVQTLAAKLAALILDRFRASEELVEYSS